MSELFFISPVGLRVDYNYATLPFTGSTQAPYTVDTIAPGELLSVRTTGDFPLPQGVNAKRGQLRVRATAGPVGQARALAFLVDNMNAPTKYVGLGLDAFNRPMAFLQDRNGVEVGRLVSLVSEDVSSGAPIDITLAWQTDSALVDTRFAHVIFGGVGQGSSWNPDPIETWVPFVPKALLVGGINQGALASLQPFNGTIQRVNVIGLPGSHSDTVLTDSLFQFGTDTFTMVDDVDAEVSS